MSLRTYSEKDLLNHTQNCVLCGKYDKHRYHMATYHLHEGHHHTGPKMNVKYDSVCSCGCCCGCFATTERKKMGLPDPIEENVYYMSFCQRCVLDYDLALAEDVTYHWCVICAKALNCPKCDTNNMYGEYRDRSFSSFDSVQIKCQNCNHEFKCIEQPISNFCRQILMYQNIDNSQPLPNPIDESEFHLVNNPTKQVIILDDEWVDVDFEMLEEIVPKKITSKEPVRRSERIRAKRNQ